MLHIDVVANTPVAVRAWRYCTSLTLCVLALVCVCVCVCSCIAGFIFVSCVFSPAEGYRPTEVCRRVRVSHAFPNGTAAAPRTFNPGRISRPLLLVIKHFWCKKNIAAIFYLAGRSRRNLTGETLRERHLPPTPPLRTVGKQTRALVSTSGP